MNQSIGKILIIIGAVIAALGFLFLFKDSIPLFRHLGRLPGDIRVEKENFSFYFPVMTCVIISVIASLVFYFIGRIK